MNYILICCTFIIFLFSGTLFANQSIIICGTGDSQELLKKIANAYELKNPDKKIFIPYSIGSGAGIKETALGNCNLGRVARNIKDNEKKYGLNYILFAYSPIVFVTNKNVNNISNLNEQDIIDIFSGKITQWDSFNKNHFGKIYVVIREPSDSSHDVIKNNIDIPNFEGKVIFTTPETVDAISKHENTITYLPLSAAINNNLNILKFNNIEANGENIINKSYKLFSPFALVYKGSLDELSKSFIEFLSTKEARLIMEENGAIQAQRKDNVE